MKRIIYPLFILSLAIQFSFGQDSNQNLILMNPSSYPWGGNINMTTTDPWAREFSLSYNGSGKLFSFGSLGKNGQLVYGYIGGNTIEASSYRNPWMVFMPNGNIGVGTTTPAAKFDIKANADNQDLFRLSHPGSPLNASFSIGFGKNNTNNSNTAIDFKVQYSSDYYNVFSINRQNRDMYYIGEGYFGIGTDSPQSLLSVNGTITSKEVKVTMEGWSDFVFQPTYQLKPLEEVETYIKENQHLPDVPSEATVKEEGIALGEMDATLLQKIEELTLYVIDLNKKYKNLEKENQDIRAKNQELEKENTDLKSLEEKIKNLETLIQNINK